MSNHMATISIKIDVQADAAYIKLLDAQVHSTVSLTDDVNIDLDAHGRVIGLEVLTLEADIPFTDLIENYHVTSDVIESLRQIRPSVNTFLTSIQASRTPGPGRDQARHSVTS